MTQFIAKKRWGQHFLCDSDIVHKIANSLSPDPKVLLEIGPGTGALTKVLVDRHPGLSLIEVDADLVDHLKATYTAQQARVILYDFLQFPLNELEGDQVTIIGNLPYNISSQIFFRVLEYRQRVNEVVAMIQQEVAARIVACPGSKTYGILSVLLQAFYDIEYLFDVPPQAFVPPPKVQSAVIRMRRNNVLALSCDERLFFRVVKACFNQRRKTIKNALKALVPAGTKLEIPFAGLRAEQLDVSAFVQLTQSLS